MTISFALRRAFRRGLPVALTMMIGISLAGCGGEGPSSSDLEERAKETVELIFAGDYAAVREDVDEALAETLSEEQLAAARAQFEEEFGTFESMDDPEVVERGDLTVVNVPLHMSEGEGEARITYDSQGKIAGLFLLRLGVPVP